MKDFGASKLAYFCLSSLGQLQISLVLFNSKLLCIIHFQEATKNPSIIGL